MTPTLPWQAHTLWMRGDSAEPPSPQHTRQKGASTCSGGEGLPLLPLLLQPSSIPPYYKLLLPCPSPAL